MTISFEHALKLFPKLAERLGVKAQSAVNSELDAELRRLKSAGVLAAPKITDGVLADAFDTAQQIAEILNIEAPDAHDLNESGFDLEGLVKLLNDSESSGRELFVLAPHGLGVSSWQDVFNSVSAGPALEFSAEILREFTLIDRFQDSGPLFRSQKGIQWSLRLVPAENHPSDLGFNHEKGPHVTLPEMLTLQFMQLVAGRNLLDETSFTWLAGTVSQGRLAPRHIFDRTENKIMVSTREGANQGPHMGSRHPRWLL